MNGPIKIRYEITEFSCSKCDFLACGYVPYTSVKNSMQYISCRHPENPNGPNNGTLIWTWRANDDVLFIDDKTPDFCPFLQNAKLQSTRCA
jgi:hypothetical protein